MASVFAKPNGCQGSIASLFPVSTNENWKKKILILIFQGKRRQLSFPADYMFGNRRHMKYIIATIKVVDYDSCELQCYLEPNCVNFKAIPDSEGLHECELNNATHRSHDKELMNRDGYIYKGAEVRNINLLSKKTKTKKKQKQKY